MSGKQLLHMVVIPVCLLLAHVLALPSDYVSEPCMVIDDHIELLSKDQMH